jgi:hypothetical protein
MWERHIRGTMPDEVVQEIKHTEENLPVIIPSNT